jgi:F-type H+-transporting ATPase subunit b
MLKLMIAAAAAAEHGEPVHHAEPTALFLDPTGWVALAMLAVFALFIWKKVPDAIGKALDKKIAAIRDELDEASAQGAEAEELKREN